jgi:toxin ParE1/3/4
VAIEWSLRAIADIRDLKAYIAKDSPYYARRFTERIVTSVERLAAFPKLGRRVPEAEGCDDVRELSYQGYRIIYLIRPKSVFWGLHLTGVPPRAVCRRLIEAWRGPTCLRRRRRYCTELLDSDELLVAHWLVSDGEHELVQVAGQVRTVH